MEESVIEEKLGQGALICIPTYNERDNIVSITGAVLEKLPGAHVLVIDDQSPDGTGKLADEMATKDERIHVLHRSVKEGLGKAYLDGFAWALVRDYLVVVEFDADFSHDPDYLPEMIARLAFADVVVGSRRIPGGGVENWGLSRKLISSLGSLYARSVLGISIKDLTGGFNGFRRDALQALPLSHIQASGYGFQIEIKYRAVKAGLHVEEMPIVFKERVAGKSKMSMAIFIEAMLGVIRMRLS
jgi:dolichol-phosphate mannosyltransferase